MRSHLFISDIVLSTPVFSISSVDSRMPAVSTRVTGIPPIEKDTSIVSLVVPGFLLVIARSRSIIALKRVDLPTFGLPSMAIRKPLLYMRPSLYDVIKEPQYSFAILSLARECFFIPLLKPSSSEISSSNSTIDRASTRHSFILKSLFVRSP